MEAGAWCESCREVFEKKANLESEYCGRARSARYDARDYGAQCLHGAVTSYLFLLRFVVGHLWDLRTASYGAKNAFGMTAISYLAVGPLLAAKRPST